jgi:hypothetical protein
MKKSILIIENSNHYHVLDSLTDLYKKKNYEVTLALTWTIDKEMIQDMFNDCDNFKIIDIKSKNLFFWKLLFKKNKYDLIHISTGAENTYLKFLPNIFLFSVFSFLYKNKIILQIRNSKYFFLTKNLKNYFKTNIKIYKKKFLYIFLIYSFSNFFRYLAYKNCKICLFESNTQLIFFNKYTRYKYIKKNYFLYSSNLKKKIIDSNSKNSKIVIGIPGSYSPERRNYDTLINAFNNITAKEYSKLKIVFMGNFSNVDNKFINFFKNKNIEVLFFKKFVSTSQYVEILNKCNYLLSLHQKKSHPFTFAGSGIIGDLNSYDKKIILRKIFDPFGEFSSRAIYFEDLSKIFKKLVNGTQLDNSFIIKKKNNSINKKYDYIHACEI